MDQLMALKGKSVRGMKFLSIAYPDKKVAQAGNVAAGQLFFHDKEPKKAIPVGVSTTDNGPGLATLEAKFLAARPKAQEWSGNQPTNQSNDMQSKEFQDLLARYESGDTKDIDIGIEVLYYIPPEQITLTDTLDQQEKDSLSDGALALFYYKNSFRDQAPYGVFNQGDNLRMTIGYMENKYGRWLAPIDHETIEPSWEMKLTEKADKALPQFLNVKEGEVVDRNTNESSGELR